MAKPAAKDFGFSLLEILVALTVLLVLAMMSVPKFARYLQVYQLDSETQWLSSNLEIARYTAISGRQWVVVQFNSGSASYECFEDKNQNGTLDGNERRLGNYRLPPHVHFGGSDLMGPPSDPSSPVSDPITFNNDRVIFNNLGKINGGIGTIYLENDQGDASAISFNIASRFKVYRWDKSAQVWK
ncbi:MAG: GspH/FimT family protein [Terriglobia bacterium]